ncbi:unnamed protein product, partial [marine sediment metagenome]
IVEQESESIVVKNGVIEAITHSTSIGFGVRVLKDSAWGFSSSNVIEVKWRRGIEVYEIIPRSNYFISTR